MTGLSCPIDPLRYAAHGWQHLPKPLQEISFQAWAFRYTGDDRWILGFDGDNPLLEDKQHD